MENNKINLVFYAVLIIFLAFAFIMIKDFRSQRVNDYKEYTAAITTIVKQKNDKIRILYTELVAEQKENADLKNTLADTRNSLDSLSKKLAQPAPAAAAK